MKTTWIITLGCAALVAITSFGCKSKRRGLPVGSNTATFQVKLTGPFENEEQSKKAAWQYELSNCVPQVNGVIGDDNVVTFKSAGIHKGVAVPCQIRVKALNVEAFSKSFYSPEEGTFYWAREVPVKTNAKGEFYTEIGLEKIYTLLGETPEPPATEKPEDEKETPEKPEDTSDVTIDATTESCADGEVFDIAIKKCVKA